MADAKIIISAVDNTKVALASVKSNLNSIESAGSSLNGVIGRLAPLLGAATFTAFLKGGIDTLDMLGDLSDRTGVAATTLSGFQLVAAQSDTSLEELGKGLNKLSIYMAENGEAAAKLGITAKDPAEAFIQLSKVLSDIEIPQQRAAIANKILGKSYQDLLPALLQGDAALRSQIEKGREYAGVTEESVAQAQAFNDQLDLLKIRSGNVGVSIATYFLPSLNEITSNFIEINKKSNIFLATLAAIGNLGVVTFEGAKNLAFGTDQENLEKRQLELLERIGIAEKRNAETSSQGNKKANENARRNLINMRKELSEVTAQLETNYLKDNAPKTDKKTGTNTAVEDVINPGKKTKSSKDTAEVAKEAASEYSRLYGEFTKIIEGTNELSKAEQALADIQAGKFADLLPWQQEQLANLAREVKAREDLQVFNEGDVRALETEIELQNEQLDIETRIQQQRDLAVDAYDKVLEGIARETEELQFQASIQGLSKQAQEEKIAARNVEIELQKTLNDLADQGLGLSEDEIIALRDKYTELQRLNTKLDDNKSTAKEIGLTFKSGLEDAIVEGKNLSDVFKGIEQDILRIVTRKAVTEPLLNGIGGLFKDFNIGSIFDMKSFIPGMTANAKGNVYSGQSISAYSGSVVSKPTFFASGGNVMGEAGPEGIFPLKRGKDGKLGISADGAGGGGVNFTLNIIGAPQQPKVQPRNDGNGNFSIDVIFDSIKSALTKDIRSEGPFAQTMQAQYGLNRAAGAR